MEKLTIQEEDVMRRVWHTEPCFVKDVLATFEEEKKPPYTTLASIIKNLERKKYVKARRCGNTYQYYSLIAKSDYKRTFMSGVVTNYFADSYKEMVSFFAKEQKISSEDLKEIIHMIEKGKE
ncbi:BlaI/MecI/CopY family transcriptional regulator [Parabacteroides sp. OttesenSCG-928-O15]|nr:BlaI/MecI/CopY family transcriptional regulator [Parabacteroides sp. OttesenSCG-928-O15]